eukprot:TRINITY_DN392_c0_g1_i9.p1 TRINITY_DN392_c0_g1~~TRINITY_DN392_c0_g1_i9.p1  ORF type:complete len:981 (+),score=333.05 TRINITY_DN392_c0_g1_i9:44-2986(+)
MPRRLPSEVSVLLLLGTCTCCHAAPIRLLGVFQESPPVAPYAAVWNPLVPCEVLTDACLGGYPAVSAWMANFSAGTRGTLRVMTPDYKSRTTLAHPSGLQINFAAWLRLGVDVAVLRTDHFLLGGVPESTLEGFVDDGRVPMVLSNFAIEDTFIFMDVARRAFVKEVDGVKIGFLSLWSNTFPGYVVTVLQLKRALPLLTARLRAQGVQQIVATLLGFSTPEDTQGVAGLVDYDIDLVVCGIAVSTNNRTAFTSRGTTVLFIDVDVYKLYAIDLTEAAPSQWSYSVSQSVDLWAPIPHGTQDSAQMLEDVEWMQQQLVLGTQNDYIVAQSTKAMPLSYLDVWNRPCFGSECESGSLTADALRAKGNTDVGFINGGSVRGPGWPAGPIRRSALWSTYPFANRVCVANMTGTVLLDVLNHGVGLVLPNGSNPVDNEAGLFPQISGMRMAFDPQLPAARRVVSVVVFDADSQQYVPLQHTRMYSVTLTSFIAAGGDGYTMLRDNVQSQHCLVETMLQAVDAYLKGLGTYTPQLDGRTSIRQGQALLLQNQSRESCSNTQNHDAHWQYCEPCPPGLWHPDPDAPYCVERSSSVDIAMIVGIVLGAVAVVAAPVVWKMTEKTRKINALYNNNKIAEECAVAVMDLRLSELDYLNDLPNPNRIQSAFVAIVRQMKLYMEFMPKNLIANYQAKDSDETSEHSNTTEKLSCTRGSISLSRQSSSSRSAVSRRHPRVLKATYARKKRLSVLALNSRNHMTVCAAHDTESAVVFHSTYIEKFAAVVEANKGIAESMCGDRLAAAWNTVVDRASHAQLASHAGLQLQSQLKEHGVTPHIGISTGTALFGLFGGAGTKKYDILGNGLVASSILMLLNKTYGTSILVSQRLAMEVATGFYTRIVDYVLYKKLGPKCFIHELASTKDTSDAGDEWMYEMEQAQIADPYAKENRTWQEFITSTHAPSAVPERVRNTSGTAVGADYVAACESLDLM